VKWRKKTQRHTHKDTDREKEKRTFVFFSEERRTELN
jgi:hypothetical protein